MNPLSLNRALSPRYGSTPASTPNWREPILITPLDPANLPTDTDLDLTNAIFEVLMPIPKIDVDNDEGGNTIYPFEAQRSLAIKAATKDPLAYMGKNSGYSAFSTSPAPEGTRRIIVYKED